MVFIYIRRPYTPRDATLANPRTCTYRYRWLIFSHCKHNLSQEHLLKSRNYQQLASPVQFENELPSSLYSVGFILRQHSQINRRGLYTLFLTSKSRRMQKKKKNQLCRCPTYHTKRAVLIRSLRRRPCRMKPTAVGLISLTTVSIAIGRNYGSAEGPPRVKSKFAISSGWIKNERELKLELELIYFT